MRIRSAGCEIVVEFQMKAYKRIESTQCFKFWSGPRSPTVFFLFRPTANLRRAFLYFFAKNCTNFSQNAKILRAFFFLFLRKILVSLDFLKVTCYRPNFSFGPTVFPLFFWLQREAFFLRFFFANESEARDEFISFDFLIYFFFAKKGGKRFEAEHQGQNRQSNSFFF